MSNLEFKMYALVLEYRVTRSLFPEIKSILHSLFFFGHNQATIGVWKEYEWWWREVTTANKSVILSFKTKNWASTNMLRLEFGSTLDG